MHHTEYRIPCSFLCVPGKGRLPWSDACRLAQGRVALISRRALFGPFDKSQDRLRELVRPPQAGGRLLP